MPLGKLSFFAYVISRERRAPQRKKVQRNVSQVKRSPHAKTQLFLSTFKMAKNSRGRSCPWPFNCKWMQKKLILDYSKQRNHHTPGNVSVSSKHILSIFDDGNRVIFAIAPVVKATDSPAVSGGAVTELPQRVQSNSRRQELRKATLVRYISTYYSRMVKQTCNKKE